MGARTPFPRLTAEEAAELIHHEAMVAFSGFTPAGAAKAVPQALAARARRLHAMGQPFRIKVLTGASTGALDEALAEAEAISWRAPYQNCRRLRAQINAQETKFVDMHLSHVPAMVNTEFFGNLDVAVIEAIDLCPDGRVYLSTSVGASPSFLRHADRVIVELNRRPSIRLWEMHDIVVPPNPPHRPTLPLTEPLARIGTPFATVDPAKIVGVVETDAPDGVEPFVVPDEISQRIAQHVVEFLLAEHQAKGRIPPEFLPIQAGVGNISNAVMAALGTHPDIPRFTMYTEVIQDSQIDLMRQGRLIGASSTSLTLSDGVMREVFENMDFFTPRIVLRPMELSNSPGVVIQLGVIAINVVLEMDIGGMANSTHVCGTQLMNGVGGSGDFMRNAYLSIAIAPSLARGGKISTVVPMVSHVDHNEHDIQVLVTEQGLADLRGLGPMERAEQIIEHCAHPAYRDYLHGYLAAAPVGHFRHDLRRCFELHQNLLEHGAMLPDLKLDT